MYYVTTTIDNVLIGIDNIPKIQYLTTQAFINSYQIRTPNTVPSCNG